MATVRPSDFLPLKFGGLNSEDGESHWLSYEDYVELQNWAAGDEKFITRFKTTLHGDARKWYARQTFTDYADLKTKFKGRYANIPANEEDLRKLTTLCQTTDENYVQFGDRVTELTSRLKLSEAIALQFFLKGLKEEVRKWVVVQRPKSIPDAVIFCKEFEGVCDSTEQNKNVHFSALNPIDDLSLNMQSLSVSRDYRARGRRYDRDATPHRRNSDRWRSPSSRSRSPVERGNRFRDYRQRPYDTRTRSPNWRYNPSRSRSRSPSNDRSGYGRRNRGPIRRPDTPLRHNTSDDSTSKPDVTCFGCGQTGHYVRDCKAFDNALSMVRALNTKTSDKPDAELSQVFPSGLGQ